MKPVLVFLFALLGTTAWAQADGCTGRVLALTDASSLRAVKLGEFSMQLPECLVPEKRKGIEGWGWVFQTSELRFVVYEGPNSPGESNYQKQLPSFVRKTEVFGGRKATMWKYEKSEDKLRYVAAIRFGNNAP